ncbi:MAG: hypothetical protein JWM68_1990 [Verrucomicrobiales bacterium]|nr:hypothetical protein [Verrucomicrobiales bacterium]
MRHSFCYKPRVSHYWQLFVELIVTPFQHLPMIWGIVPLYFGWILNELTSSKANFRTALQTGFSFIWASLQWLYPHFSGQSATGTKIEVGMLFAVNMFVTFLVLGLGIVAFFSGLFRKFPPYGKFLGYTRFSTYFMIAIFPMQAHYLGWSWDRLVTIVIFGIPIWMILHFGLMPVRK